MTVVVVGTHADHRDARRHRSHEAVQQLGRPVMRDLEHVRIQVPPRNSAVPVAPRSRYHRSAGFARRPAAPSPPLSRCSDRSPYRGTPSSARARSTSIPHWPNAFRTSAGRRVFRDRRPAVARPATQSPARVPARRRSHRRTARPSRRTVRRCGRRAGASGSVARSFRCPVDPDRSRPATVRVRCRRRRRFPPPRSRAPWRHPGRPRRRSAASPPTATSGQPPWRQRVPAPHRQQRRRTVLETDDGATTSPQPPKTRRGTAPPPEWPATERWRSASGPACAQRRQSRTATVRPAAPTRPQPRATTDRSARTARPAPTQVRPRAPPAGWPARRPPKRNH